MLSVIVVNYNTRDLLLECLYSLKKHLRSNFEVIVVDNNSKDKSAAAVRSEFPNVHLIKLEENRGFGFANNVGMREAQGDIFWLLNTDTKVNASPHPVLNFMEKNQVGIVGSRLVLPNGSDQPFVCGDFFSLATPFKFKKLMPFSQPCWCKSNPLEVDWVTGASMFVSRRVYEVTGGFDEDFFMYFEDQDFCYRAKNHGFKIYYYPQFSVEHKVGQSFDNDRAIMKKNYYASMRRFIRKTRPPWEAWIMGLCLDIWEKFVYRFI